LFLLLAFGQGQLVDGQLFVEFGFKRGAVGDEFLPLRLPLIAGQRSAPIGVVVASPASVEDVDITIASSGQLEGASLAGQGWDIGDGTVPWPSDSRANTPRLLPYSYPCRDG
jgi:hypothetical protein